MSQAEKDAGVIQFPPREAPGAAPDPARPVRKPSMDWLEEEAESPAPAADPTYSAGQADGPPGAFGGDAPRRRPWLKIAGFLLLCAMGLATAVLSRHPVTPSSPALDAERGAAPPDAADSVDIGEAPPLTPPTARIGQRGGVQANAPELSARPAEAAQDAPTRPLEAPALPAVPADGQDKNPGQDPGQPRQAAPPAPGAAAGQPAQPALDVAMPAPSGGEAQQDTQPAGADLAAANKRLDMLLALVERLERSERVLASRVNGLELASLGRSAAGAEGTPAEKPPRPRKTGPKPPAAPSQRRAQADASSPPLPFFVESVDTWNGEKTVVVRDGGRLAVLKPGDRHAGWRVESADGRTVTLRGPGGGTRTATAGEGGQE